MNYSDQQLVASYLKGNEHSLEVLIKRYLKPIYSFVFRYTGNSQDAEDITQEVFVKAWRNLKKFNQNRSFKTWIFSIAKNTCIDFLKKKKTIPFSQFENEKRENILSEELFDKSPLPDEIFEKKDLVEILNKALESLPIKYRLVLFLRYNDHFTFKEIAEILGESINTIKSRHQRAIQLLKKILKVNHIL